MVNSDDNKLEELLEFIDINARQDLKHIALDYLKGYTAGEEIPPSTIAPLLPKLLSLSEQDSSVCGDLAAQTLVNLTRWEELSSLILSNHISLLPPLFKLLLDPASSRSGLFSGFFSNLSRDDSSCLSLYSSLSPLTPPLLIPAFTSLQYNKAGADLSSLGHLLANFSRLPSFQLLLLPHLDSLLPLLSYPLSSSRRWCVAAILKNISLSPCHLPSLLSPSLELLPRLLFPLSGPGNEISSDSDMDLLPLDLQYLDDDKQREESSSIRLLILETLFLLCSSRSGRDTLRSQGCYIVLREYEKWEQDQDNKNITHDIAGVLLRTEDEIGADNIRDVEIPSDVKFVENQPDHPTTATT